MQDRRINHERVYEFYKSPKGAWSTIYTSNKYNSLFEESIVITMGIFDGTLNNFYLSSNKLNFIYSNYKSDIVLYTKRSRK